MVNIDFEMLDDVVGKIVITTPPPPFSGPKQSIKILILPSSGSGKI